MSSAPIMPGQKYTHKFKAYPPGSHFWHAHMDSTQVDKGVKGPIVIHTKVERYADLYEDERPIFMTDARRRPQIDMNLEGEAWDLGSP